MTDPAQLVNAETPEWSPDGTRIIFSAFGASGNGFDIFVMGADGSGITNLSNHAGSDLFPAWQP